MPRGGHGSPVTATLLARWWGRGQDIAWGWGIAWGRGIAWDTAWCLAAACTPAGVLGETLQPQHPSGRALPRALLPESGSCAPPSIPRACSATTKERGLRIFVPPLGAEVVLREGLKRSLPSEEAVQLYFPSRINQLEGSRGSRALRVSP